MQRIKGLSYRARKAQDHLNDQVHLVSLISMVDHQECVQVGETVEQVHEWFRHHPHDFAAVVDGGIYAGLISRGHLGFLLGTRFGFTLHSRHLIQQHLLPESIVAVSTLPLLELLETALARVGEAFYHDVPLVDPDGKFIGIIPVPALVRAQSSLIAEQFYLAEARRDELISKNHDLFRSLHLLRQSQGRYETLFQHSPLAVALLHPDGRIEAHNSKLQNLLGPAGELEGFLPNLADLMSVKHRESFLELLSLHESGASLAGSHLDEFTLQLPALGERLFKFHTSLVRETGQICTILHDITEQRAIERKMAINDKAELFESLVGGIAHELNNKLAPVLGFSELLQMKLKGLGDHEVLQSYCNAISTSAQESVRIIRQLLQLSRPATMDLSPTDLGAILDEALSIMRFRLRAVDAEMRLIVPEVPVWVLADAGQIKQVLINLMINAVDAMDHSPRRVLEVRVETHGSCASLSVSDTGHGISSDKLNRIFDPFYTTKPVDRGTGLGLSVCLGIIRQHHGEISVKSIPGEGSQFVTLLPLANVQTVQTHALSFIPARRPGGDSQLVSLAGHPLMHVLVIDDEDYITSLVQEILRSRLGWRVERVHDGRQAIQRLESARFDLVITDLRMPGVDGFAILAWIREFQPALLSKVLVITGDSGGAALDQQLLEVGVPAIRKPFTPDELIDQCQLTLAAG